MRLTRRRTLAAGATALAVTPLAAGRQTTPSTEWTATYDPGGQSYVRALAREGNGYLAAGGTIADEDRVWLLPVAADGTASDPVDLGDFTGSIVDDAAVVGGRRVVAGTRSEIGAPARPWVAAYDGRSRAWTHEPEFDDDADRRVVATVPVDGDLALVVDRSPSLGGSGTRFAAVTRLTADGAASAGPSVGSGEGGFDAPLSVDDAAPTGDGGLLLAGRTGGVGERTAWIGAVDADGLRWGRRVETIDGTDTAGATACRRARDGDGYLVGLFTAPTPTESDPWLLRVGPTGETRWRYDADGDGPPEAIGVTDGGVVTGGSAVLQDAPTEYWLAWLDAGGDERWAETVRTEGSVFDAVGEGEDVIVAGDRGNAADARRLALSDDGATTTTDDGGDGATATATATATETATITPTDDSATDADGSDGDASTDAGGDGDDDGGGLPLPGFGPGAALAAGALGVGELLRRRDDD